MEKLSFNALLISLCLMSAMPYRAASQSFTDGETIAFVSENRNNPIATEPMVETRFDFIPGQAKDRDFEFLAEKKMLVLMHTISDLTRTSLVHIQDATGRNIRSISINPKEAVGTTIPLSDLLEGSYYYVLILDTGQKIQGAFEIGD